MQLLFFSGFCRLVWPYEACRCWLHGAWHKNALLVHKAHHSLLPRLAALFSFTSALLSPSPFFFFFSVHSFCNLYPYSVPVPPCLCSTLLADRAVPITATRCSLPFADATVFRSPASDLRPLDDRQSDSLPQQGYFTSLKPPLLAHSTAFPRLSIFPSFFFFSASFLFPLPCRTQPPISSSWSAFF